MPNIPDSCASFSIGDTGYYSEDDKKPLGVRTPRSRQVIQTTVQCTESPNGSCSILKITTRDRPGESEWRSRQVLRQESEHVLSYPPPRYAIPGLLVDIVKVLKDVNMNVVSAEVDTVGTQAQDEFFVTYRVSEDGG